jgi:hypothetical protein
MFSFLVICARIDCSAHLLVPIELVRPGILTHRGAQTTTAIRLRQRQMGTGRPRSGGGTRTKVVISSFEVIVSLSLEFQTVSNFNMAGSTWDFYFNLVDMDLVPDFNWPCGSGSDKDLAYPGEKFCSSSVISPHDTGCPARPAQKGLFLGMLQSCLACKNEVP